VSGAAFDGRAPCYDELRPVDANWWEVYERIVALGGLAGRRVLELGCGTGRLSHALTERAHARVFAVDVSEAMVGRARALGVNARLSRAERLPFKPGWFDAAVMRMVAHLIDRPRAFAETARVLAPGGRLVVASEDPARFETVWFARYFPSVPAIDAARFPAEAVLRDELAAAGFGGLQVETLAQERSLTRARALRIIEERAYSTFDLLSPGEYAEGLARARRELPGELHYRFDWLLACATLPA